MKITEVKSNTGQPLPLCQSHDGRRIYDRGERGLSEHWTPLVAQIENFSTFLVGTISGITLVPPARVNGGS